MAADTGIEPVSLALTGRCITLMLIRKNKVERDKGVEPFIHSLEGWCLAVRPTPLKTAELLKNNRWLGIGVRS
jgi:hypothetical protein